LRFVIRRIRRRLAAKEYGDGFPGFTRPSIFNDDLIIRGLRNAGVSERDARYYCHSTCVEITPIASSNILVATPYVNSARVIEHILSDRKKPYRIGRIDSVWVGGGGMDKENIFLWDVDFKLSELDSFDKFFGVCKEVLASLIGAHAAAVCDFSELRLRYQSCPLASAFLDDCIERGKDAGAGGARYNFIYPTFPGIINLIDSIAAVKKAVYDEKLLTFSELGRFAPKITTGLSLSEAI
jgi:formate C-acetyltransferase